MHLHYTILCSVSQPELAGIAHAIAYFNHPSSAQCFARVESALDTSAVRSLSSRDLCMLVWSFSAADVFSERVYRATLARGASITARPIDVYQIYQADLTARIHLGGGDGHGHQGFLPKYVASVCIMLLPSRLRLVLKVVVCALSFETYERGWKACGCQQ